MRESWAVPVLIAFHLGVSVGLLAGRTLDRVPDPPVDHLERLLREIEKTPRLEWQQ
jgi:hypothetical protein